jgi:nitrite reductase (NADH) small subunit
MQEDILWICVGALSDIPRSGARCVQHGERTIAIFRNFADQLFALEDVCTNCDGPISQGIVSDLSVYCPICNWEIDLRSGKALGGDVGQVMTYPIRLEGGQVLLGLSSARQVA